MNEDVKAEWVACLRSGDYEPGRYQLRDLEGRFDPIGVLMDRAVAAGVIGEPKFFGADRDGAVFFGWAYDGSATRVTPAVEAWADLPYWIAHKIQSDFDYGKTFEQIADYIEENL